MYTMCVQPITATSQSADMDQLGQVLIMEKKVEQVKLKDEKQEKVYQL